MDGFGFKGPGSVGYLSYEYIRCYHLDAVDWLLQDLA
jgi:hypothetical protein